MKGKIRLLVLNCGMVWEEIVTDGDRDRCAWTEDIGANRWSFLTELS